MSMQIPPQPTPSAALLEGWCEDEPDLAKTDRNPCVTSCPSKDFEPLSMRDSLTCWQRPVTHAEQSALQVEVCACWQVDAD